MRCRTGPCCVLLLVCSPALADEPMSTQSGPGDAGAYFESEGSSGAVVLPGVPAYDWYHGCGPTAAASIIGYHDLLGFDDLFDASGWDDVRYTRYVRDEISSPAHNAKYDPKPDDENLPVPPNTSIACWFRTSVGGLNVGWSYQTYADDALEGYATYRGYECTSWWESYSSGAFSWADLTAEIDAGRPMMFLVDSDGDESSDHFIPVLGYEDRGDDGNFYAFYDTWSEGEDIRWEKFQGGGNPWGVMYGTFFSITQPLAPGDANGDGQVDASDAAVLAEHWLMSDGVAWGDGDFNNDNKVDDLDASILAAHWGHGPGKTSPVPEPSMATLLILAAATLSLRRARRARPVS